MERDEDMTKLNGSCTNRSLWFAAAGSFAAILCVGVVLAAALPNVTICHKGNTIVVDANSLPAHLAHGDTLGTCDNVCACQPSIDPVTCSDGNSYLNQCIADCAGATDCTRACACDLTVAPVTCSNGNTYTNQCVADCEGATNCSPTP